MAQLEVTRRKVVRVEIEFADGEVATLEGDEADRYQQTVIEQGVHAWNHGQRMKELAWKRRNKNCKTCGGSGVVEDDATGVLGRFFNRECPDCFHA